MRSSPAIVLQQLLADRQVPEQHVLAVGRRHAGLEVVDFTSWRSTMPGPTTCVEPESGAVREVIAGTAGGERVAGDRVRATSRLAVKSRFWLMLLDNTHARRGSRRLLAMLVAVLISVGVRV